MSLSIYNPQTLIQDGCNFCYGRESVTVATKIKCPLQQKQQAREADLCDMVLLWSVNFVFWLIERGSHHLWGYTGFISVLCKTTHIKILSLCATTSTHKCTHTWLRADARQKQTVESNSSITSHAHCYPSWHPDRLRHRGVCDELNESVWVSELLLHQLTVTSVHSLHLLCLSIFSIPHTTQTERAQWAGHKQMYSWNLKQIYKINGRRNNKKGVIQFHFNDSQTQRNKAQLCYHWCLYPACQRLTCSDTYMHNG